MNQTFKDFFPQKQLQMPSGNNSICSFPSQEYIFLKKSQIIYFPIKYSLNGEIEIDLQKQLFRDLASQFEILLKSTVIQPII